MTKKIISAGILGGIALALWTFVINGLLGFNARINMKQVEDQPAVYEVLKVHITEPGHYVCNPELTSENRFPEGEPVFSILYGGMGHEAAGMLMLAGLAIYFATSFIAAWMLSGTSAKIQSSYIRKVSFFIIVGLLFAIFSDLARYGIGDYPLKDAVLIGLNHILTWTVMGSVIAWRIKPE